MHNSALPCPAASRTSPRASQIYPVVCSRLMALSEYMIAFSNSKFRADATAFAASSSGCSGNSSSALSAHSNASGNSSSSINMRNCPDQPGRKTLFAPSAREYSRKAFSKSPASQARCPASIWAYSSRTDSPAGGESAAGWCRSNSRWEKRLMDLPGETLCVGSGTSVSRLAPPGKRPEPRSRSQSHLPVGRVAGDCVGNPS